LVAKYHFKLAAVRREDDPHRCAADDESVDASLERRD
jgi:hypothetical protein